MVSKDSAKPTGSQVPVSTTGPRWRRAFRQLLSVRVAGPLILATGAIIAAVVMRGGKATQPHTTIINNVWISTPIPQADIRSPAPPSEIIQVSAAEFLAVGELEPDVATKGERNKAALLREGIDLFQTGNADAAIWKFEAALQLQSDSPEALNNIGVALLHGGKLDAAERNLRVAREVALRLHGDDDLRTLAILHNLALLLRLKGLLPESEELTQETLERRRDILGDEHPYTLTSMNELALLYQHQGRYEKAEPLSIETLEIGRRVLGEEHLETLSFMQTLGLLYLRQGRYELAEELFVKTLEISRRLLVDDHPSTLSSINNMGVLLRSMGKLKEAEPYFRKALEGYRRVLSEEHPDTLSCMNNLAGLYAGTFLLRRSGVAAGSLFRDRKDLRMTTKTRRAPGQTAKGGAS